MAAASPRGRLCGRLAWLAAALALSGCRGELHLGPPRPTQPPEAPREDLRELPRCPSAEAEAELTLEELQEECEDPRISAGLSAEADAELTLEELQELPEAEAPRTPVGFLAARAPPPGPLERRDVEPTGSEGAVLAAQEGPGGRLNARLVHDANLTAEGGAVRIEFSDAGPTEWDAVELLWAYPGGRAPVPVIPAASRANATQDFVTGAGRTFVARCASGSPSVCLDPDRVMSFPLRDVFRAFRESRERCRARLARSRMSGFTGNAPEGPCTRGELLSRSHDSGGVESGQQEPSGEILVFS